MATFEEQLAKLNDAQRTAVETIEGPVMVIAGPGTGKTQVVGLRVANILERTQMRPSNILCLTFSNSGASAMRERLRSLIGSDAYGVKVATIHGFCNEIIAQHPHVFEEWSAMEQISDIDRYRTLNLVIDDLMPHLAIVNRKHPYARTRDILGRISQLKREGKDNFEALNKIADAYETELSGKSKAGTKAHERNVLQAKKFRELLTIYEKYQEALKRSGRYDYDDMILNVILALQEEEWLLASLQERYQYILVDEFQDTNGAQYRFIELLTTLVTPDQSPNLFVVGDDDQAIYRFQGANLQNLLSFHTRFPKAPIVVLTVNYRSTQLILDAAGKLITENTERLVGRIPDLQKHLVSAFSLTNTDLGESPKMIVAASNVAEPWLIADLIDARRLNGRPYEEIAILTQINSELRPLYDVLRARNIPVQMVGKVDLLAHPLIQQFMAILKSIYHPDDSSVLAAALACDRFKCHPADLGRLFALRRDRDLKLSDLLLNLETLINTQEIDLHHPISIFAARDTIFDLHQKIHSRTVVETVQRAMENCGFLTSGERSAVSHEHAEVSSLESHVSLDPLDFSAVQAFFNHVCDRSLEQPHYLFGDLMNDLSFYEHPDYGDLRLQYAIPQLTERGVRLMTAHQSKGLEFETVIIANFREGHWDKRRNPPMVSMPEDLLFGWNKDQKSYEQNQDERRVAFVAMTRAKRELLFLCAKEIVSGDKIRTVAPSAFFAEAGSLPEVEQELLNPNAASTLLLKPLRNLSEEYRAYLKTRLENFELSVTALNRFLNDPQEFLRIDLLQMPQPFHPEFLFGNAIHTALRHWGVGIQQGSSPSRESLFSSFESYLVENSLTTDAVRLALTEEGREVLPRYFDERLAVKQPVIHRLEFPVRARLSDLTNLDLPSIPLKGVIDRIDLDRPDSSRATLIDYKTGKPKTENEIRDSDLYRQIVFYSLLFELGNPMIEPHTFILDFIGNASEYPVERAFQISQAERDELKLLIRVVWEKIQDLDFTPIDQK